MESQDILPKPGVVWSQKQNIKDGGLFSAMSRTAFLRNPLKRIYDPKP